MNGRLPKRLRRALFDEMVRSGTVQQSSYQIKTFRKPNGEPAQMLVCTGFRKIYKQMIQDLKKARRPVVQGSPDMSHKVRARRRRARARVRVEYRRRAAEIRAAREQQA